MQVGALGEEIDPLLLEKTPAVLSVGRRCVDGGCSFIWKAGEQPYLIDATGKRHQLEVDNYVPYPPEWRVGAAATMDMQSDKGVEAAATRAADVEVKASTATPAPSSDEDEDSASSSASSDSSDSSESSSESSSSSSDSSSSSGEDSPLEELDESDLAVPRDLKADRAPFDPHA